MDQAGHQGFSHCDEMQELIAVRIYNLPSEYLRATGSGVKKAQKWCIVASPARRRSREVCHTHSGQLASAAVSEPTATWISIRHR